MKHHAVSPFTSFKMDVVICSQVLTTVTGPKGTEEVHWVE